MLTTSKAFFVFAGLWAAAYGDNEGSIGPYPTHNYPPANYPGSSPPSAGGGSTSGEVHSGYHGPYFSAPLYGPPPIGPGPILVIPPVCKALENIKTKISQFTEPLLIGGVGIFVFHILRSLFFSHIESYTTEWDKRMDGGNSILERVSNDVARALSEGVCTEAIACSLGMSARQVPGAKAFARILTSDAQTEQPSFVDIVKTVVTGTQSDCAEYKCVSRE